jgi:hypothetical protein
VYPRRRLPAAPDPRVPQGTTLIYLPSDAYAAYVAATGAAVDNTTGLLTITDAQYAALQPLTFDIGTAGRYTLSPNAQIWPRARNADLWPGANVSATYLVVANVCARAADKEVEGANLTCGRRTPLGARRSSTATRSSSGTCQSQGDIELPLTRNGQVLYGVRHHQLSLRHRPDRVHQCDHELDLCMLL